MSSAPRLSGVRVVVAEDDGDLHDAIAELLELEGAEVTAAATGGSAFDAFQRVRPDIVVSDLWMPGGNGFELVDRIRQLPVDAGRLTPAVAVSAAENMRSAVLAGFHAFVAKPFEPSKLVDTIADFAGPDQPQAVPPWTIAVVAPGALRITLAGAVARGDARALANVLRVHLEQGPVEILLDLRGLASLAPSAASVAERAIFGDRQRIRRVAVVGGSWLARLVVIAACRMLGIPCAVVDEEAMTDGHAPA